MCVYVETQMEDGRRGRDRMLVGFITTYAISTYHQPKYEFESGSGEVYLIQHYMIKFVSGLAMVMVFNATFNNMSVISWRSVLLVEDTGVP
jgi:hypothetical protein